jgi:thiamine biosynthesis lipoprotein
MVGMRTRQPPLPLRERAGVRGRPFALPMVLAFLLLLLSAFAQGTDLQRFEFSEVAMGVRARIVVYAPDQVCAQSACRAAFERIAELEDVMSDYRPTSELRLLCAKAGGPPVKVSQDLLAILVRSQDLARRSNGAFDVTAGPLVKLWRNTRKSGILPSAGELSAARKLVGWRNVTIDPKAGTVRLALPGMQLDLGGIAKGFACDEAIRVLKREGVSSALVEMGGVSTSARMCTTHGRVMCTT